MVDPKRKDEPVSRDLLSGEPGFRTDQDAPPRDPIDWSSAPPLEGDLLPMVLYLVQQVSAHTEVQSAAHAFLVESISAIRPDGVGSVFLLDTDMDRYSLRAVHGLHVRDLNEFHLPDENGEMMGWEALRLQEPRVYAGASLQVMLRPQILAHHGGQVPTEILVLPLVVAQEVIGFVNVEHYSYTAPLNSEQIHQFQTLARFVAPLLANAQRYEQTRRREQLATNLNRVLQAVNQTLDLDEIIKAIRKAMAAVLRIDLMAVIMLDPDGNTLKVLAVQGNRLSNEQLSRYERMTVSLAEAESVTVKTILKNKPYLLTELSKDKPMSPFDREIFEISPFRSALFYPLRLNDEPVGVIAFANQTQDMRISATAFDTIGKYVSTIVSAIQNARLLEESRRAQQELMMKNLAIQGQTAQIQLQNEQMEKQSTELESLVKILHAINQEVEMEAIMGMLLDQGMVLLGQVQAGVFMVYDTDTQRFRCLAQRGYLPEQVKDIHLSYREATQRYMVPDREVYEGCYLFSEERPYAGPTIERFKNIMPNVAASLVVLVHIKGALVGIMVFDNTYNMRAFEGLDPRKLQRLKEHAAGAFSKARYMKKIQQQKQELELTYGKIRDSIGYARRILEAILPRRNQIERAFPQSFVFFRPKDVVSGDFFWFSSRNNRSLIAAVDCTGHGIPGAFMSVLGNTLLNQIVNERGQTDPGAILNELNRQVKEMLGQFDAESETFDGMDIALLSYDADALQLQFAGANRPLYLYRKGTVMEHKGQRHPVGGSQNKAAAPFETITIDVQPGDSAYIFTDGYVDQFSSDAPPRKLMPTRLKELLREASSLSMQEQARLLEQFFDQWRGTANQLDDVLVIGLRFDSHLS